MSSYRGSRGFLIGRRRARRGLLTLALLGVLATAAACGGDDDGGSTATGTEATPFTGETITVYSGREEEIVEPLFAEFEQATGISVEVRYGGSSELAATLLEEGDRTPADVFFAQDAGSLGALSEAGLLGKLPEDVLARVDTSFRDAEGEWIGTSGRLVYNTEMLGESDLPPDIGVL